MQSGSSSSFAINAAKCSDITNTLCSVVNVCSLSILSFESSKAMPRSISDNAFLNTGSMSSNVTGGTMRPENELNLNKKYDFIKKYEFPTFKLSLKKL